MTNDTSTLNGSLLEMKDQLIYELAQKGVTANYDSSTGLLGLIDKIEDIEQSGSEQEIVSFDNLTTEFNYTQKRGNYGFSVTIPSGVTTLGSSCFNGCTGLTSIAIPSSVTTLESGCFSGCTGLTNITIPSGVTSLPSACYYNCTGLTNVTIPSSVTSLESSCFSGCTNLVDYQLYWETPPVTWSSSLMPNNTNTYFTIPNGTTANYTAKGFPSDKLIERSA